MGVTHVNEAQADTETVFGTTAAGAPVHLRMVEGTFKPRTPRVVLPDMSVQDRLHENQQHRHGSKFGGGFDASFYLDGLAAGLDDAATYTHPENNIAVLLRALMGGESGGPGSTVAAGTTTTALTVATGEGVNFVKGRAVCVLGEVVGIKEVAGDVVTLKRALVGVPPNGTTIFQSATFFLDEDNVGGDTDSLQFLFDGPLPNDQWLFQGCGGTFTLETTVDALLTMACSIQAAKWTGPTASSLSTPTYVGGGPLPASAGYLWWTTVGSTTRNLISTNTFSVDPGLAIVPQRTIGGVETVGRWRQMRAASTCAFTTYGYEDFDEFWTEFASATTKKAFMLQVGDTPISGGSGTGVVAIELPCVQYKTGPERGDKEGLIGVSLSFDAREDQDITSPTTGTSVTADLHRSKIRIHLF